MDRSSTTSSVSSGAAAPSGPARSATAAPGGAGEGMAFVPISQYTEANGQSSPAPVEGAAPQPQPTTRAAAMSTAFTPREHSPSVAAPPVSSEIVRAPVSVAAISDRKSIVGMSEADKKVVAERVEVLWRKWEMKTKPDDTLDADKVKLVVLAESVVTHTKLSAEQLRVRVEAVRNSGANRVKQLKEGLISAIEKAGLSALDDVEQQSDALQSEANKAGLSSILSKGHANANGNTNGTSEEETENCRSCKSGCALM